MSKLIRPWYWPEKGQPERTEPFTWIVEDVIAASWWPDPYVFQIYEEKKIRGVVNCCEVDNRQDVPKQFSYHHINVPDYGVPTDAQIERFLDLMDKHHAAREAVVVHCARAGYIPKNADPVQWIRARRKCCLETGEQINCAQQLTRKHRPKR